MLPLAGPVRNTISIHALREEGDPSAQTFPPFLTRFLSTPSARRATKTAKIPNREKDISIHALREEGDWLFRRMFKSVF